MSVNKWELQPGGLYLAVTPFNKAIPEHREAASTIMRATVQTVAKVHGAEFNNRAFHNNLRALYTGDIKLDLYLAKWEVCEHKPPIYLGAALGWDTVGIDPQGNVGRARYIEDTGFLNEKLFQLVRSKPADKKIPEEGLLTALERISLRAISAEEGMWFKYGEVNPSNKRMLRAMERNGGTFGRAEESAVLEFQKLPSDLLDRFPMKIHITSLKKDGVFDNNNFIARWPHKAHDIRFIVTRAQATAIGEHRVDIRPWHNGNLPSFEVFECVIASVLRSIKHDVEIERKWGQGTRTTPSPVISLLEPTREVVRTMYEDVGTELLTLPTNKPKSFDHSMPDAHVNIINDRRTLDAFIAVGARPRRFGTHLTTPGVNVLRLRMQLVA